MASLSEINEVVLGGVPFGPQTDAEVVFTHRDGSPATAYQDDAGATPITLGPEGGVPADGRGRIEGYLYPGSYNYATFIDGELAYTGRLEVLHADDLLSEIAVIKEAPINVDSPEYGGDIQAAIDAIPQTGNSYTSGGEIFIPQRGADYDLPVGGLNMNDQYNTRIFAEGAGGGGPVLRSVQGSGSVLSMRSARSCRLEGFTIDAQNASFVAATDRVIDARKLVGGADTSRITMADVQVFAPIAAGARAILLDMVGTTIWSIEGNCYFKGGGYGLRGRDGSASAEDFSNAITVARTVLFAQQDVVPILNPGDVWDVFSTFEPRRDGKAAAILSSPASPGPLVAARGLNVVPWTGDASAAGGIWFDVNGVAINFEGGVIDGGSATSDGIRYNALTRGLSVVGVEFRNLVNGINPNGFVGGGASVHGNRYNSVTNPHATVDWGTGSFVVDLDVGIVRLDANQIRISKALQWPSTLGSGSVSNEALFWDSVTQKLSVKHSGVAKALQDVVKASTYGATVTTDCQVGDVFTIVATNTTAFAISNPTNAIAGKTITYDIKNNSGGVMGAITWGAAFLLAGAFTNPANTKRRTISFYYDGTNWIERGRAGADI